MVIAVVTHSMANVPSPEFQKLWPNVIESLRLEYGDTTQQYLNTEVVMERVCWVLIAIACLAECTPASVGESSKWTLIILNMVDTRRNLRQLLKGRQLCSALYGVYTDATQLDSSLQRQRCQRGDS
jgi:hypothetical protein